MHSEAFGELDRDCVLAVCVGIHGSGLLDWGRAHRRRIGERESCRLAQ
jgi:hypothetical protein